MRTKPGERQPNVACREYVPKAIDQILRIPPLAVTFAAYTEYTSYDERSSSDTTVAAGVVQVAKRLVAADIPVLCIKSTPRMQEHVPECLAKAMKQNPAKARENSRKPAVLPGLALLAPPPRRAYAAPMGVLRGLFYLASLNYADTNPAAGYFMTQTRLYELGQGGLLAMWAEGAQAGPHAGIKPCTPASHPTSHWPRTLCTAAGLVAIGASGFLFTARLQFPGAAALVPVVGVAAVIAAGVGVGCDAFDDAAVGPVSVGRVEGGDTLACVYRCTPVPSPLTQQYDLTVTFTIHHSPFMSL